MLTGNYTIAETKVNHKNRHGAVIKVSTAWAVKDGDFTLAVVPTKNSAEWLAERVNLAITRASYLEAEKRPLARVFKFLQELWNRPEHTELQ